MKEVYKKIFIVILAMGTSLSTMAQVRVGQYFLGQAGLDRYGEGVSMNADGSVIAIGAVEQHFAFFPPFNSPGYVEVYELSNGTWVQRGNTLTRSGGDSRFGGFVSLNETGDILAVGDRAADSVANNAGAIEVFQWDGTSWNPLGQPLYGDINNAQLGTVRINAAGNRLVAASWLDEWVKVYELQSGQWVQMGATLNGPGGNSRFGSEVLINGAGDRIAVNAPYYNLGVNWTTFGKVQVFDWDGTQWTQVGSDFIGTKHYGYFGEYMDFDRSGNTLVICEKDADVHGASPATAAGQIYVLDWDGLNWAIRGDTIRGTVTGNRLGVNVAISANGNRMVYGEGNFNNFNQQGKLQMLEWDGSTWNEIGYPSYSGYTSGPGIKRLDMDTAGTLVIEGMPSSIDSTRSSLQEIGAVRVMDLFTPAPTPVVCSPNYNPQVLDYPASLPYQKRIQWNRQTVTDSLGNPQVVNLYQLHYRASGDTAWNTIFVPDTQRVLQNLEPKTYEYYVSGLGNENPSCEESFDVSCATNITYGYNVFQAPELGRKGRATVLNTLGGRRKYDIAVINSSGDTLFQGNRRVGFFTDLDNDSYTIHLWDAYGCAADSVGQFTINPLDTAWIPYLISASNNSPNGFKPVWNTVDSVLNYQLRILNVTDGVLDTFITGIIDTSIAVNNLTPGKLYRFNVRSRYFNGVANVLSGYSNPRSRNLPIAGNKQGDAQVSLDLDKEVRIYPVPAKERIHIQANIGSELTLLDMSGRELVRRIQRNTEERFELFNLPSGIYTVRIITEGSVKNRRFVKQ